MVGAGGRRTNAEFQAPSHCRTFFKLAPKNVITCELFQCALELWPLCNWKDEGLKAPPPVRPYPVGQNMVDF